MGSSLYKPRQRGIPESKLNDKQLTFVYTYLGDAKMNAERAAEAAGYAKGMGQKLRNHKLIKPFLDKEITKRLEVLHLQAYQIVEEIRRIAFVNPKKMIDPETGCLYQLEDMPDEVACAIRSVTVTQDRHGNVHTTVDFHDKLTALNMLYRHFGLDDSANPQNKDDEMVAAAHKLIQVLSEELEKMDSNIIDSEAIERHV